MQTATDASVVDVCNAWCGKPILTRAASNRVAAGGGSTCAVNFSLKCLSSNTTPCSPPVLTAITLQIFISAAKPITLHLTPSVFNV